MTYLTFVNSNSPNIDDILRQKGEQLSDESVYDFVVPNNDPSELIGQMKYHNCSSTTIWTPGEDISLHEHVYLLITKPGEKITEGVEAAGTYTHLLTSRENLLKEIQQDKRIAGYLELRKTTNKKSAFSGQDKPLKGRNYRANDKPKPKNKEVNNILMAAEKMSYFVEEFSPSLIYAPARGAHPITSATLWFTSTPQRVYFPVTSSFVIDGRDNNKKEIARLHERRPEDLTRLLYIEEVVSGGMTQGHSREIQKELMRELEAGDMELKVSGIIHENGDKLDPKLRAIFKEMENNGKGFFRTVPNLFTLDNNTALGIHYLDYSFGPHVVPFLDSKNEPYADSQILQNSWKSLK